MRLVLLILLLCSITAAQTPNREQNVTRFGEDMGRWEVFDKHYPARNSTTAQRLIYFSGPDSIIVGPFRTGSIMGIAVEYADSSATNDSLSVASVRMYQWFDADTAFTKPIYVGDLRWRSHTSSTSAVAATAYGTYGATPGEYLTYLPIKYTWLMFRPDAANKIKLGNYMIITVTTFNQTSVTIE